MLFPLFGINATVNNGRITAIIGEDTKQEIKEKVSCFFAPILLISGCITEENTAAKLAESTPRMNGYALGR